MNAPSKMPPYRLPASDPIEGPLEAICDRMRRMLEPGQFWAVGDGCAFEVQRKSEYDVFGILRSYADDGSVRWQRDHFYFYGYFAGIMVNQERRPIRWFPSEATEEWGKRVQAIETD